MRISIGLTIGAALVGMVIVGVVGFILLQPQGDLISEAGFSETVISPNADGENDITTFSYTLSRNARVTITFTSEDGRVYVFRDAQQRIAGDYSVNFSGVVDGFRLSGEDELVDERGYMIVLPDEEMPADGAYALRVERRMLPDGVYTWTLEARDEEGEADTATGTLRIENGDNELPAISAFDLSSDRFTPNQDGVRDRVQVSVYLEKGADLSVYLEDDDGVKRYLSERVLTNTANERGIHEYDYDGEVDAGFEPPPDGQYTLYAVAQDDEGQRVVRQNQITIEEGGLPQAAISAQVTGATVCFSTLPWDAREYDEETGLYTVPRPEGSCSERTILNVPLGDLLVFHLTVENYGRTPLRTNGPFPGTVYEWEQLPNTLDSDYIELDGVYRVGIHCNNVTPIDNPWRWALGTVEELEIRNDVELDDTFYYLPPNPDPEVPNRAEVWGAIRVTEILESQNPMQCGASLIHEGVGVDPFQSMVGRREIKIIPPDLNAVEED
jgi:hypothetical protein